MSKKKSDKDVVSSLITVLEEFENYFDKIDIDTVSEELLLTFIHRCSKTEELVEDLVNYKRRKNGKNKLH